MGFKFVRQILRQNDPCTMHGFNFLEQVHAQALLSCSTVNAYHNKNLQQQFVCRLKFNERSQCS